ncbi:UPF0301 protein [Quillaja saponaria]|uniref:UPF0301 protein n=1 Tax=Quillaja saponaria TaxID=32244 RepID=A0AAD7PC64_QUISA|nr:UPF0301 protein [Quillaja saponaria]
MDLWAVHVKNAITSPLLLRNTFPEKPISWNLGKIRTSFRVENGKVFEIRVSRRKVNFKGYQSFVVRAMGKKNQDNSSGNGDRSNPEGDGIRGNNSSDDKKSNDSSSDKSHHINLDWREFRAKLFSDEQEEKSESDTHSQAETLRSSKSPSQKWAHPIPIPETGCVLVATEKLDGVRTFERTVVLLLRSGTRHPQEGPFGVIINRPLEKKIKHMKPTNLDLATTFSDCSLHFGGPLEASIFLLKTKEKSKLPGFQEVISGLSFGARNNLDDAAALIKKGVLKPQDFRFFVGYAGWQLNQLREEIESDYWYVAACSSNLICGGSSEGLWQETLQLMGGHYSELSRKPKQDI